ncbi:hypothetical protein TSUD_365180 [Trifolium subterraneum]|uniref:Uncharacterized protein n=1 Tax=Trifolium subterraneum TaxID=3900 RepID=A0A2Z6P5A8_TRISU|nr:hypothetical protein TSUD_365180 [Trifolium subterraneum]
MMMNVLANVEVVRDLANKVGTLRVKNIANAIIDPRIVDYGELIKELREEYLYFRDMIIEFYEVVKSLQHRSGASSCWKRSLSKILNSSKFNNHVQ